MPKSSLPVAMLVASLLSGMPGASASPTTTNALAWTPPPRRPELAPQGRFLFQRHCAVCHGVFGDGRGEMAGTLIPRPRNFTRGVFKFRSTPSGFLPTDEDLARTIRGGLAGTAMPKFTTFSDPEIAALIAHLKSLSPRWQQAGSYSPPVEMPARPAWIVDDQERRRRVSSAQVLFQTACAPCHGLDGRGAGAAPAQWEDAWGHPIQPTDLQRGLLRAGRRPEDIFRVLSTGLDGTPMPSFLESFDADQRWALAALIADWREPAPSADRAAPGRGSEP